MSSKGGVSKKSVIEKYRIHDKDTGSPEVQIALLTKRIEELAQHFSIHPKDNHSKRGMLNMINRRKKLLNYLKSEDVNRYRTVIASLGLRK